MSGSVAQGLITGGAALLGTGVGGWVTSKTQSRLFKRDRRKDEIQALVGFINGVDSLIREIKTNFTLSDGKATVNALLTGGSIDGIRNAMAAASAAHTHVELLVPSRNLRYAATRIGNDLEAVTDVIFHFIRQQTVEPGLALLPAAVINDPQTRLNKVSSEILSFAEETRKTYAENI